MNRRFSTHRSEAASTLLVALGELGVAQERLDPEESIEALAQRVRSAIHMFRDQDASPTAA